MAMSLKAFEDRHRDAWNELDALADASRGRAANLDAAQVRRLGDLHRACVADLAYARRRFSRDPVTTRLEDTVGRSRSLLTQATVERPSFWHFVTTGYWQRVRERPKLLALSALALFGPMMVIGLWSNAHFEQATEVAQASPMTAGIVEGTRDPDTQKVTDLGENSAFSAQIFTNNARIALAAFAGGMTGGLFTVFSLVFNGVIIGFITGLAVGSGQGEAFTRLVVPHGVLELSLIVAAGTAGLRLGLALLRPGTSTRWESVGREARPSIELAGGSAALLVPCGLIEGFLTPRGLTLGPAVAVGVGLGIAYWGLVWWRGRRDEPVKVERVL